MKWLGLFFSFLCGIFAALGQETLSVKDIYSGVFRENYFGEVHSLANGKEFVMLEYKDGKTALNVYDYQTFTLKRTLVSSEELEGRFFSEFSFSPDEEKILLTTDIQPIYRHSKLGNYLIYDLKTKQITPVFKEKIQEPLFSPDGKKIAFFFENNLYINDLEKGNTFPITSDGKRNSIINGIADWVYEEEFSKVVFFDWSSNGKKLAFVRFDESKVPLFSMDIYGGDLYPTQSVFKYPKAGEENSKVSLFVYDYQEKKSVQVPTSAYYLPYIKWTKDANSLAFVDLNRHQNDFQLKLYNTATKALKTMYRETDKAYIELPQIHFTENNNFFITSEKDGFNHIYQYDISGKLLRQVTQGKGWEVTDFYGFNEQKKSIYYQSTERGSINRDVYAINLNNKKKQLLSPNIGTNNANFSNDFSYYILRHHNAEKPLSVKIFNTKSASEIRKIVDNDALIQKVNSYSNARKEFKTFHINGNTLNAWILKPANFDEYKKYPVLMYQYSGPGSQSVKNSWFGYDDYWYLSLTQKGYIVVCVDGRGTGMKGADFKKVTYMQLGKYETEDQIKCAMHLATLPYVDNKRIGIWGWSFGGFTATNALFKGENTFKMGIAVAPVTSWRFYDSVYTERFMRTPQENPKGYDENSPLFFAKNLKSKYLLIHGTADDNVHIQNSMRLIEALIQENKSFDWRVYPDKNHGIYGGNTRVHLYEELTTFIENNL